MAPPQTQHTNSDAVARAATERADKLERELKAKQGELDAVKSKLAHAEKGKPVAGIQPGEPTFVNEKGQVVPERFRGTKTYTSRLPYYRLGDFVPAGAPITVTDEMPGKTWSPMKPRVAAEPVIEQPVSERPSDMQV